MATVLGLDGKLYYDTAGVGGSTWDLMENVRDLTLNLEAGEADVTTRASNGWRENVPTLKEASVEWQMVYDTADAGFTAVKDAFLAGSILGLAVMDGLIATPGSQGLHADCGITSFSRNEALEEAMTVDVVASPQRSTVAPDWVTIV